MARYVVERNYVSVIGTIWMPAVTCAMEYVVSAYDVENMKGDDGELTRESIACWLSAHSGDFQCVDDFRASIGDAEYPWSDEESECIYNDCMYGSEA